MPADGGGGGALADVQATLYDLITAPEGVAKRLAEQARSSRDLEAIVRPGATLTAAARVDVYADMYFYRIRDALRDEYPKLVAVVGDDGFHNLVTDYLIACPPAHPSLREAGARLPAFVAGHALGGARAWIAELARLERTQLELYDGPDADALTFDDLRATPPDALPGLALRAVPCHALLHNRFAIAAAWQALDDGEAVDDAPAAPERLLVWRRDVTVHHRAADADEAPLLELIRDGATFERVCERLLATVPEADAPARAFHILARWAADGLLAATPTGSPPVPNPPR